MSKKIHIKQKVKIVRLVFYISYQRHTLNILGVYVHNIWREKENLSIRVWKNIYNSRKTLTESKLMSLYYYIKK